MNVETNSIEDIIEYNITPSIYDLTQLNEFTNKLIGLGIKNYPVHIKLNTGMNRLGFDEDEIKELCNFLINQPEIKGKEFLVIFQRVCEKWKKFYNQSN